MTTCINHSCRVTDLRFNYRGEVVGVACYTHKLPDMVNVVDGIDKHLPGMVNDTDEQCLKCEASYPRFNYKGNKKGVMCYTHKESGMVNVVDNMCQYPDCESYATWGPDYMKPTMCVKHKEHVEGIYCVPATLYKDRLSYGMWSDIK